MKVAIRAMKKILLSFLLAALTPTDLCCADAGVIEGLVHPSVLPMTILGWDEVPLADLASLIQANGLTDEQVGQLVQSDDALDRGLAIYLLNQRGNLRCLVDARALLGDDRPTIPEAAHPLSGLRHCGYPATVAGYLRCDYKAWFGLDFLDEQAVRDVFAGVTNLDHLVRPWINRFRRAEGVEYAESLNLKFQAERAIPVAPDAFRVADVKEQVAELPPNIRWVVVASAMELDRGSGGEPKFYSEAEATSIIQLAAAELGGHIDPDASPAWSQPGMTPDKFAHQKEAAIATLQRLAPNLISTP